MKSHNVTITDPISEMIRAQVDSGRFKDFSTAVQEALWNYFLSNGAGAPSIFQEYGVTAEEVEKSFQKNMAQYRRRKKAGQLKEFKF